MRWLQVEATGSESTSELFITSIVMAIAVVCVCACLCTCVCTCTCTCVQACAHACVCVSKWVCGMYTHRHRVEPGIYSFSSASCSD